jgi:hypothetical protein
MFSGAMLTGGASAAGASDAELLWHAARAPAATARKRVRILVREN